MTELNSQQLKEQLAALQEQIRIAEQREHEERVKNELSKPLTVKIDSFNRTRKVLAIKCSHKRDDYVAEARKTYSRKWLGYVEMDEIHIGDFPDFHSRVTALPNVVWEPTKAEETFNEFLNQPDVRIDFVNSQFLIFLKDLETYSYDIFGYELRDVTKFHTIEQYFSLPYNEGGKLLTRIQYIETLGKYKIVWEPLAIEAAEKELSDRNKINEIAKLGYNPDYDFDLNGCRLHPFQTVGVGFADHSLFEIGNDGVLICDEMGLGKSVQALAIAEKRNLRALILTPAAGRDNWMDYVMKFTGKKAAMFMKTEPDRYDFEDLLLKKVQYNIMALDTIARGKETGDNDEKGEPIVKYLWSDLINLSRFDLIIVDEVHKCKNEEAGRTKALMLLKPKKFVALSGTPILNRPAEFAPILSKVDPKNFANTHQFAVRYSDGKNGAKNTKELAELLRPIMIRRKKSEVLPDLPPVIPMVEQYIMNDREQQLYDAVFNQVLDAIPDILPAEDDRFNFFANNFLVKIMRLKQVCALMVADSVSEFAHDAYHNSESDHKKVIIFSQFIPVVEKIFKNLGNEALFITGESHSPTERLKIVKEFNADPHYKYLVASTKAASEQLNITAAGTVIFNDLMWTPADHDQAIGRAYGRLNDCHGVDAHFFVVKDTIMAWIQGILSQKSDTFKSVVDGVEVDRQNNTSVIQELIKMLRGMKKK